MIVLLGESGEQVRYYFKSEIYANREHAKLTGILGAFVLLYADVDSSSKEELTIQYPLRKANHAQHGE